MAFDFLHGFSTVESRRVVDHPTGRYMLDPEYGVVMVKDLENQSRSEGCGRHSNLCHVKL